MIMEIPPKYLKAMKQGTQAPPGSIEKINIMCDRHSLGMPLHAKGDAHLFADLSASEASKRIHADRSCGLHLSHRGQLPKFKSEKPGEQA